MNDLSEFVTLTDTTLTTDSRRVAKHFKKLHKNVLRAYDKLECSPEFNRLNFEPVEETDAKGESRRVIRMTKDGFIFLVRTFTGAKAAGVFEAYIKAFNAMAEQLQQIGMSLWDQRLELERRDATSFMWASFGSKRMLDRKRELPEFKEARDKLLHDMEPPLFSPAGQAEQVPA